MSYEGYTQKLCVIGHLTNEDAFFMHDGPDQCQCGSKIIWSNMVDQTNGCEPMDDEGHCQCGMIPLSQFPVKYEAKICPCCKQVIEPALYDMPVNSAPHTLKR